MSEFDRLVHLTGWIGETPDGTEAPYLLATTNDPMAGVVMPVLAVSLGLNPERGSVTMAPVGDAFVAVSRDLWAALHVGDDRFERPVSAEWALQALGQKRVVLAVGYLPMGSDDDPLEYVERAGDAGQVVLGIMRACPAEEAQSSDR